MPQAAETLATAASAAPDRLPTLAAAHMYANQIFGSLEDIQASITLCGPRVHLGPATVD